MLLAKKGMLGISLTLLGVCALGCKARQYNQSKTKSTGLEGVSEQIAESIWAGSESKTAVLFGEPPNTPDTLTDLTQFVQYAEAKAPGKLQTIALELFSVYQPLLDKYLASSGTAQDEAALLATRDREALRGWLDKAPLLGRRENISSDAVLGLLKLVRSINANRAPQDKLSVLAFDERPNTPLDFRYFQLNLTQSFPFGFGRDATLFKNLKTALEKAKQSNKLMAVLTGDAHAQRTGEMELSGSVVSLLRGIPKKPDWLGLQMARSGYEFTTVEYGKGSGVCKDRIFNALAARGQSQKVVVNLNTSDLGTTEDFRCKQILPGVNAKFVPANYKAKDQYDFYVYLPNTKSNKIVLNEGATAGSPGEFDITDRFSKSMATDDALQSLPTLFGAQKPKIYLVPGLSGFQIRAAVDATVWKTEAGRKTVKDYFQGQMEACKSAGLDCEVVQLDTTKPMAVNSAVVANLVKASQVPVILIGHSRGGLDIVEALLNLSPEERAKVKGVVTLNSPHLGIYPADIFSKAPGVVKNVFSMFYNVNDELSVKQRDQYWIEKSEAMTALVSQIPMVTVGSWLEADNQEKSLLHYVGVSVGKLLPKNRYVGLNDGIVAIEDTRLPNVPFVVLAGQDHISPAFVYGGPLIDQPHFFAALIESIQPTQAQVEP